MHAISGVVPINKSKLIKLMIGIIITIACLTAAVWGIDPQQIKESFQRANFWTLPVLLLLLFVFFWFKALRWRMLLEPIKDLSVSQVTPAMMIGFMGNNILPAHLGEFLRVYVLSRQFQIPKTTILSTVVLERLFDIVAILCFLGVGISFAPNLPDHYRSLSLLMAIVILVMISLVATYLIWTERVIGLFRKIFSYLSFLPSKLTHLVLEMMQSGAHGMASMKSKRLCFGIIWTSFAQWAINGLSILVALWSFDIQVTPLAAFVVLGVTAFGVTVPSTPGFFGVIQLCFWISLQAFGVSKADAFAASIYYQLSQYIPVTLIGLYFSNREGLKLNEAEREAEKELEELEGPDVEET
ncbi:MAG: lysylphosphatidylglycerol synthase transmembrane domain-containing protein [Planctomycetota bacterium]|jgi:glycosyltransferase 2 family protein|uniref:lysylphosphatidylglycerol synthase transmembrane domain-containing protein n=1 Tax=uncultured Gimesia sp. TaxID=1678688 RepID=UPI0026054BB3|nr:lysylphosphatidylglycerol synthase transmembrane domain-containing protein [uncultured Gimesia sp.]